MIKIQKTIGEEYIVEPKDVEKVKRALNRAGHYEVPDYGITPYPDRKLFEGIRSFQKDHRLRVDGVMKPDGETVTALNAKLSYDLPFVKGPTLRCPECGAPHGGSKGDLCPDCHIKQ